MYLILSSECHTVDHISNNKKRMYVPNNQIKLGSLPTWQGNARSPWPNLLDLGIYFILSSETSY